MTIATAPHPVCFRKDLERLGDAGIHASVRPYYGLYVLEVSESDETAALLALNQQRAEALTSVVQTVVTVVVVVASAPFGLIPATAAYAGRPIALLPLPALLLRWRTSRDWRRRSSSR